MDSGLPPRLRTGVWSVVGRAIDSLIGGGAGSTRCARSPSGVAVESDDSEQESVEHRRPPTDAELRARMRAAGSPSSESGPKHASGVGGFVGARGSSDAGSAQEIGPTSATEHVVANVPIALTPMQPPPDVLAAMKGRAASGRRRQRFSTPPDDVAVALAKTRAAKIHGQSNVADHGGGAAHGDDGRGTRYT